MSDIDTLVSSFVAADVEQRDALERVNVLARVKHQAVMGLRSHGLTFADIGQRVGLTVQGVQRIAYKPTRKEGS
jgi:hypothetical protein